MAVLLSPEDKVSVSSETLSDLTEAFNSFTQGTQKLKDMYAQLEGRVSFLTEELERKNRELERANRLASLGQLAAGVAHEIRNPLGGIALCANLLERELSRSGREAPVDATKDLVCNIVEGVRRLNSIVENLLSFTRETKVVLRPVSLNPLVRQAWEAVAQPKPVCGVRFACSDAACGHTPVPGDADQLRRVFINIIQNSVEAMPGGGQLDVTFSPSRSERGTYLCVSFRDTGCGIPREAMEKIFNPFFTTKDTGTGLGLAISHRIVENHRGRMNVESEPGKGTTMEIFLPCEFSGD